MSTYVVVEPRSPVNPSRYYLVELQDDVVFALKAGASIREWSKLVTLEEAELVRDTNNAAGNLECPL